MNQLLFKLQKEFERIFGICVIQVCLKATLSLCQATIGNRQSCSSVAFDRVDTALLLLTRCLRPGPRNSSRSADFCLIPVHISSLQELEKVRSVVAVGRRGPEVEKEYNEHDAIMKFATGELMLPG